MSIEDAAVGALAAGRTSVLAVGLERYALPAGWDLPGAASQAVQFAEWAIRQGVPPGRVRLGCTWLDDAGAGVVERLGARAVEVGNESLLDTIYELMVEGGDLLLVYWCGHGVAGNQLERRLLTSGASEHNLANRFVADILARFQSTIGAGFAQQVFIIDACANIMPHQDGQKRALPDARIQPLGVRKARQDVYFATDVGEYAVFDKDAGTAAYSTAVLTRLTAADSGGFPPDFHELFAAVREDLTPLSHQHPVFLSIEVDGDEWEWRFGGRADRVVFGSRPRLAAQFITRDQLSQVRDVLAATGAVATLSGMRGSGKSQLASGYAQECEVAGWEVVAWITATSRDDTIRQLAALGTDCGLTSPEVPPEQATAALLTWLNSTTGDRLIVFDNVERFDDLTDLLPHGTTRVLLTSTTTTTTLGTLVAAGGYTRDQSLTYLKDTTGIDDLASADQIADALGDLPVALTQAATTIRLGGFDYPQYLTLLQDKPLTIALRRADGDPYPDAVATALATAISTVLGTLEPAERDYARTLLGAMSILADTGIPRPWASHLSDDPITAQLTVGILINTNILTESASPGSRTITLHRLLAAVTRQTHTDDTDTSVNAAIEVLKAATTLPADSPYFDRRASIALAATQLAALTIQPHSAVLSHNAELLGIARSSAYTANQLHDPYSAIGLALYVDIADEVLGPDHPGTLTSRINLASAYQSAGNLDRAIPLLEQTVSDMVRVHGEDDPDTITSRNNLAFAYQSAGDLDRAIPLYEQTLTDRARILGEDNPDTLTSRNNLAGAYQSAGDLTRAIPLHEQTLTDMRRILGDDHPDTLASRNNLAGAYRAVGNLTRAIPIYKRTLTDRARIEGDDHPDTLTSRNNLASAYEAAGNLARAIPLYEQTLADRARILGNDHPDTLTSRNNLASAYHSAGNMNRAIPLYEQTLTDMRRILGDDHPNTLGILNNLAYAYQSAGNLTRAIPLHEQTLTDMRRILGDDHPNTLTSRNNLAYAHQSAGNLARAIQLYEQALIGRAQILGDDHPDTLTSRKLLADARRIAAGRGRTRGA
ncbi:tetratricopeptide repeat protein [Microbacterium sp. DT81.1]|uniref:tetratricopeptide repeat protein n=1 Tax=Microbacterium sp. DT81.1 TaxID=3393413 RepID=UPI003CF4D832